jgi:hypothetical protein
MAANELTSAVSCLECGTHDKLRLGWGGRLHASLSSQAAQSLGGSQYGGRYFRPVLPCQHGLMDVPIIMNCHPPTPKKGRAAKWK